MWSDHAKRHVDADTEFAPPFTTTSARSTKVTSEGTMFNPFRSKDEVILTEGGLETTVEFKTDCKLREFASFEMLFSPKWREWLTRESMSYVDTAASSGHQIFLDTHTWRASDRWFEKLGTSPQEQLEIAPTSLEVLTEVKRRSEASGQPVMLYKIASIGPKYDAYNPKESMSVEEARCYHEKMVRQLAKLGVDAVAPLTFTSSSEATGVALACAESCIPCIVAFTLADDGKLPSGETLEEAIHTVDASVEPKPVFYMINCVHPDNIRAILEDGRQSEKPWLHRLKGIRANASARSHEELDNSDVLDEGDPSEWADAMVALRRDFPDFQIMGGCCGTDGAHQRALASRLSQ